MFLYTNFTPGMFLMVFSQLAILRGNVLKLLTLVFLKNNNHTKAKKHMLQSISYAIPMVKLFYKAYYN